MINRNIILLTLVALLIIGPFVFVPHGSFVGSDDQALNLIVASNPAYRPWTSSLWSPPSPEVESMIFALQAALGAGLLGYYVGFRRGRILTKPEAARDFYQAGGGS